jgi:hypothetical protein
MPLYASSLHNGHRLDEQEATELLPDDEAAREEAGRSSLILVDDPRACRRRPRARPWGGKRRGPTSGNASTRPCGTPERLGVNKIAEQYGVNASMVQEISSGL